MDENIKLCNAPLYVQIAEHLKAKIDEGYYQKNQLLPSEAEIQATYNVSRITARKAYKKLIDEGIVRSFRGKGTYVNDLKEKDWTWMRHFTSEVKSQGREPSSVILKFKRVRMPDNLVKIFGIKNSDVFKVIRLRMIDNYPVWLTTSYILVDIAEDLCKEYFSVKGVSQSLFYVLSKNFGVDFQKSIEMKYIDDVTDIELRALQGNRNTDCEYKTKASAFTDMAGRVIVYEETIFEESITKNIK